LSTGVVSVKTGGAIFAIVDDHAELDGIVALVDINDEMIAAEPRYIFAASVADIDGIEPDLQSLPDASRD